MRPELGLLLALHLAACAPPATSAGGGIDRRILPRMSKPAAAGEAAARPIAPARSAAPAAPQAEEPTILEGAQAAPIITRIEPHLARAFDVRPGGRVSFVYGEIAAGRVEDRQVVAFETIKVMARECTIDKVPIKDALLVIKGFAVDQARLRDGAVVVVGSPTVTPFITVDRKLFVDTLARLHVKDISVTFDKTSMVLAGRVSFLLLSFPFRIRGHFGLLDDNVAYVIEEVRIKGKPAGEKRRAQVQEKTKGLIELAKCLAAVGIPRAQVRGGRVQVRVGDTLLHTRDLD